MLLPKNTNPAFSTYYYGAVVLNVLVSHKELEFDYLQLFSYATAIEKMSIKAFTLALDWLYLLGSVKMNANGKIEKCF
jgi:hypothetical protein